MSSREPMLDMFIYETLEMMEQLQQIIISSEKMKEFKESDINEIFRIMHTVKGSSAMMLFNNISQLSHTIEDLFYFIRENKPLQIEYSNLTDLVLEGSDLIKSETEKIDNEQEADGDFTAFIEKVNNFLYLLKEENELQTEKYEGSEKKSQAFLTKNQESGFISNKNNLQLKSYKAQLYFDEQCEMKNIRSFTVVHKLEEIAEVLQIIPEDILENNDSSKIIEEKGFEILFRTALSEKELRTFFMQTIFLERVDIIENTEENKKKDNQGLKAKLNEEIDGKKNNTKQNHKSNLISVDVEKLDKLMDLVGELVISEALVSKNQDLKGLTLDNFNKAARQHRKRLSDLQDIVMAIRMVSLAPTLNRMNRVVRDMSKKLGKETELEIIGQDTEVDKNIIEHIGDPLMHIVRNSMDHGIEDAEDRIANGKEKTGKIIIEAKNTGGEVLITIKDDGRGLNKEKILSIAKSHGLIDEKLTDKEIYALIFLPGFSTNDDVTEYSGRGVGMDVVVKEIEKIRGSVSVDSEEGKGTTITIKIPLTLAIVDGMIIRVGSSTFTVPITAIRQSFIVKKEDVIKDLDEKEMMFIRGKCYSILRLYDIYKIKTDIMNIENGIVVMVEDEGKQKCIFADELIGEQQVVIKALPSYIKKVSGVSGCTLLGDGSISLILDISEIVNM